VKATILTVAFVLIAASLPRGQTTYRSAVDLVSFGVTVLDKRGEFVKDLRQQDFEVYEDGRKQTLKYFTGGSVDAGEVAPDLHLGVLFDISGSMEEDMTLSRSAAIKFLKTLDEAKDITLVDFTTEVQATRYGQPDFPRLVERIRSRKADGNTALYDALSVYLDGAASQEGRKILVLYTDGGDNSSELSYSDVLKLLRQSDVIVYSIGFLEHHGAAASMNERAHLRQMAEETGGQAFFPTTIKDLDGVYEKVQAEIKAQYLMGYLSTNTRTDGGWRKVEIRIAKPGVKDLKIRTRKGYFAPSRRDQVAPALASSARPRPAQPMWYDQFFACLRSMTASRSYRTSTCAATRRAPSTS
jgi:Ca-activated chloride channel family protein